MTTHSSTLAWRTPWTEAGYSLWGYKDLVTTEQLRPSVSVHRMDLVLRPLASAFVTDFFIISLCFCLSVSPHSGPVVLMARRLPWLTYLDALASGYSFSYI